MCKLMATARRMSSRVVEIPTGTIPLEHHIHKAFECYNAGLGQIPVTTASTPPTGGFIWDWVWS